MSNALTTQPLALAAQSHAQQIAVLDENAQLTYKQLHNKVNKLCLHLQLQGIQKHSHLMAVSENSLDLLCLQLACLQLGLLFCPVSPRFSHKEILALIQQLDCHYIWWPGSKNTESIQSCKLIKLAYTPLSSTELAQIKKLEQYSINPKQACNIILSSGSTGKPKAIVHNYQNHYFSALGAQAVIPLNLNHRWLLSLPIYHIGGMAIVMRCLLAKATIVLSSQQDLCKNIIYHQVTHLSLVATQLWRLMQQADLSQHKIEACIVGGGPVSPTLLEQAQSKGIACYISYGLSEMSSQVATAPANSQQNCGLALAHRQYKLLPSSNEIAVKGKVLAMAYYDQGFKNLSLDAQGWFHTGDIAQAPNSANTSGLIIQGRRSNMMISGGENIHPEEIERQLTQFSAIKQAVVVAKQDVEFGQRPVAIIEWNLEHPDAWRIDLIKHKLRQNLAAFKVPDEFLAWPQTLLNTQLKVKRQALEDFVAQWQQHNSHQPSLKYKGLT